MENSIQSKFLFAAKWSTITEIIAKAINPVSNIVLARILVPEAFGVVATASMVFSFTDILTDTGFEKYLVQHEFINDEEKYKSANVAFWTNFALSLFIWGIIVLFSDQIAKLVGNPGLGFVIAIACAQLPLTSFTSIQIALFRRDFNFKTLFWIRLITISIPFAVTIPLALYGYGYWSIIIGTIVGQLFNTILLTIKCKWKPKLFYSIKKLKEMLSFSIWSLIESISIWLTGWIDVFIIGSVLSAYYLGLYKTSVTMVNGMMGLITASVVPVLFSALSRLQNDTKKFNEMYFSVQKFVSIFVFPIGIIVFLYKDFVTGILLGSQWTEAGGVIGSWALTSAVMIVFSYFCSEVYRAKGRPKFSFLSQILHLAVLIPVCVVFAQQGFWPLVYARSWIRFEAILVNIILMSIVFRISIAKTFKNVLPTAVSSFAMGALGFFLQQINSGNVWNIISIIICAIFYYGMINLFPNIRNELHGITQKFKPVKIKTVETHH